MQLWLYLHGAVIFSWCTRRRRRRRRHLCV